MTVFSPHWFKSVKISSIALIKMAIHARSGGSIEIMGVMTGKILQNQFVVMDAIPLPVEGTETRVNAMAAGYEYMVNYVTSLNRVGHNENVVGWYHSHPGYGCWLSGIDVGTQRQSQSFQDPFLALVIDPNRTIAAGKVDIGAFRTYPLDSNGHPITTVSGASGSSSKGKNPTGGTPESTSMSIPSGKLKDFGVHSRFYYQLEISYFKSSLDSKLLDLLWNKYWASTLSQSTLLANYDYSTNQIHELSLKTDAASDVLAKALRKSDVGQNSVRRRMMVKVKHKNTEDDFLRDMVPSHLDHSSSVVKGTRQKNNKSANKNITIPHYPLIGTAVSFAQNSENSSSSNNRSLTTNAHKKKKIITSLSNGDNTKRVREQLPGNLVMMAQVTSNDSMDTNEVLPKKSLVFTPGKSAMDAVQCAVRLGTDQMHGLISQELRDHLFTSISNHKCSGSH